LVEAHPLYAAPPYDVACCERLAGRTTDAVEHLRCAIDLPEQCRSYAKGDSDFDPIRDEPAFKELTGGFDTSGRRAAANSVVDGCADDPVRARAQAARSLSACES
jgi:hypothetical protein